MRTHEEAETLAFPGSPTIRIGGRDVDPDGAKAQPALGLPHLSSAGRPRVAGPEPRATGGGPEMSDCAATSPRTRAAVHAARRRRAAALARRVRGQRGARPRPVVQPLPVRARLGGPDDRDPARLRRPRRQRRCGELERREPLRRGLVRRDASRAPSARASASTTCTTRISRSRGRSELERTPEVFLFDRDRRLVYHGAIDDNRDETAVTHALPTRRARRVARR